MSGAGIKVAIQKLKKTIRADEKFNNNYKFAVENDGSDQTDARPERSV
jgi:hypothetical protein